MKKVICVLLTLALLSGMVLYASAEEMPEYDAEDITASLDKDVEFDLKRRDEQAFGINGADTVTVDGNNYSVDTGAVTIDLFLDPSFGYICLTQDMLASVQNYFLYEDPEAIWNMLVEDDCHYLLNSLYSDAIVSVYSYEPDDMSLDIGTLSEQSEIMQQMYTAFLATSLGFEDYSVVSLDSGVWMYLGGYMYLTFVEGHYIQVIWDGLSEMTEDDLLDMEDLLTEMTITVD